MSKVIQVFLVCLLLTCEVLGSDSTVSKRDWYLPDYVKTQFAGNIGFIAVGVGYSCFGDKAQFDLFYGYVPRSVGGVDIHMISRKNSVIPLSVDLRKGYVLSPLVVGFSTILTLGNNYFLSLPDRYPEGYYWWPTALHFAPFMGVKIQKKLEEVRRVKVIDAFIEVGTVDFYLRSALRSDYLGPADILSLAVGMTFFF